MTMAAITGAGLVLAGLVAGGLGGDVRVSGLAVIALAIGSLATAVPILMTISRDYWGVAVLFSGMTRSLLTLAVAFVMSRSGVESKPLFLGAVSGAVLILIFESMVAIRILARLERRRVELKTADVARS
jgi:hypothetical protein